MEHESVQHEVFPADEDTTILAYGYYGGIWGAIAFCSSAWLVTTVAYGGNAFGELLLVAMAGSVFAVLYYILFGGIFMLTGVLVSRLIGHTIDLRIVAVISACCSVYVPLGMLVWATPFGGSASLSNAALVGLGFSIPTSFVAAGAWLAADREFQHEEFESNGRRQFDLKILFSLTLLLSVIMFAGTFLKIQSGFYIGFFVAFTPTSIVVALVAWLRTKFK